MSDNSIKVSLEIIDKAAAKALENFVNKGAAADKGLKKMGDSGSSAFNQIAMSIGKSTGIYEIFVGNLAANLATKAFNLITDAARFLYQTILEGVEAYRVQEEAVGELNQSMINQGVYSAGLQRKYLDLASALGEVTKFGDEQIVSAQAILQKHLGNREVTEDLVKATLDLATAKKMDLASAAELVGKTINGENNALSKHGVHLDEAIAKNDRLAAVIKALDSQVHGYAEAAARGLGGTARLKNAWGEMLEVVGERLAPTISAVTNKLADMLFTMAKVGSENSLAKKSAYELGVEMFKLQEKIDEVNKTASETGRRSMFGANKQQVKELQEEYKLLAEAQTAAFADEQASVANGIDVEKQNHQKKLTIGQDAWLKAQEQKMAQTEADTASIGASYEQEIQAQNAFIDKKLKNTEDFHTKKLLLEQKAQNLEVLENTKRIRKTNEDEDKADKEKLAARTTTLNTLASMQKSGNQTLATIGKAAALTQIAIATPVAIAEAMKLGPPPINYIAAAAVGATMAAQAAQVVGVQFADGGIVPGTSYNGDRVQAQVNSGEMIFNKSQQKNLFDMVASGSGGGGETNALLRALLNKDDSVIVNIGGRTIVDTLRSELQSGRSFN